MFTLKNVVFSLGIVLLIGVIECKPEPPNPKPKVRSNFPNETNTLEKKQKMQSNQNLIELMVYFRK